MTDKFYSPSLFSNSVVRGFSWTLVSPSRRSGWSLLERLLISNPILLRVVQRVDHLWNDLVVLSDLKHSSSVFVSAAIVSCGEDSEKLASSESFESVHHTLVSSQNEFSLVVV